MIRSLQGLDLSSLRMVANGAEPVSVPTLRRFIERFGRYGFRPGAMAPVYGLAENSVGLAFPPAGRAPLIDRVDREALSSRGIAEPAKADDPHPLEIASCGLPAAGQRNPHRGRAGLRAWRTARGPAGVPRALGNLRLFPQRDQDARAFPRRLARQRRPRLHGRRRGLHNRPDQGHHHPRRPAHLSSGDRGSHRRNPRYPQGMRRGVRNGGPRIRHRTGGRFGRDARDRSCGPRGTSGARARGCGQHRRYASRRDRACPAAHGAEDVERQDPPERRQGALRNRAHRDAATGAMVADPAPLACRRRRQLCQADGCRSRDALRSLVVDRDAAGPCNGVVCRDAAAPA